MATVETKNKYHVALNGVGLILEGALDRPAYQQSQVPIYGNRFASGDRSYDDLSQWWFMAQTDWSGGIKDTFSWEDDAKFFSSTQIDTWSVPGTLRLTRSSAIEFTTATATEDITCGTQGEVAAVVDEFVGTTADSGGNARVYRQSGSSWAEITGGIIHSDQSFVTQVLTRLGYLWVLTAGVGVDDVILNWDGTTWSDKSANVDDVMPAGNIASARCAVDVDGTLYVFMNDTVADQLALVSTDLANPASDTDWDLLFEKAPGTYSPIVVACEHYEGSIYYLAYSVGSSSAELWAWDIAAATNTLVQKFQNVVIDTFKGLGDRLLRRLGGKLVITVPENEIWELDGGVLTRIWKKDTFKSGSLTEYVDSGAIEGGCIVSDNKLWWSNLMYDGEVFYNTFKPNGDVTTAPVIPILSGGDGLMYFTQLGGSVYRSLYALNPAGTAYNLTADSNYIVFSNFDLISGVDKLLHGVTILFNKFASGQSIVVEYSTDEMSSSISWTTLGTASHTLDGASVTDKTFLFAEGAIAKKVWFRIKLNGGGTNTPVLNDFVLEHLPFPTARKQWQLAVNLGDEVERIDGGIVDKTGRELRSLLESAWWTKSVLDFQDLDYAVTAVNENPLSASNTTVTVDSTDDFPEQGRIRIDSEEILYTGKTKTAFTGCTRGARDTRAASHSDNAVVSNAYKVLMTAYASQVPTVLEGKNLEYIATISLREV